MKIALLGCGVVGSGVRDIIDSMKNPNLQITKILVKNNADISEERMTTDILEILNSDIDLVIECIGGIEIPFNYISMALNSKKHVVTSNKKVLATHYEKLLDLAKKNDVILAFEASVGGGIPWIRNIQNIKKTDEIFGFKGIFNGTTNYILDNMTQKNLDFHLALQEAQNLGYAESEPSDDIDAHDVRYKCCITANTIWDTSVDLKNILCFGIRNIEKRDIIYANENNKIIKLIGQAFKEEERVNFLIIPTFIDISKNMAHLPNNLNYVLLNSSYLGESAYIGQGAGKYPTAHAVVQDVIFIKNSEKFDFRIENKLQTSNNYVSNFYIRSSNLENFKDIILKKVDENIIITKEINLSSIAHFIDKNTFIAEMKL